jgi:hypothetical protein
MTLREAQLEAKKIAEVDDPSVILEWFDGRKREFIVTLESNWMNDTDTFLGMTDTEFIYKEEE